MFIKVTDRCQAPARLLVLLHPAVVVTPRLTAAQLALFSYTSDSVTGYGLKHSLMTSINSSNFSKLLTDPRFIGFLRLDGSP